MPVHKLNAAAEANTPYQHSDSRVGEWRFNENVDVDLREDRVLNNKEINEQRNNAFLKAVEKINENFKCNLDKDEAVDPNPFRVTIVDEVFKMTGFGEITTVWYPVEMEGTFYRDTELGEKVPYKIHLDIDNPELPIKDLQGPHGPHIGYHFTGAKNYHARYGFPSKVTGHILLNRVGNEHLPDRARGKTYDNKIHGVYVPIARVLAMPGTTNSVLERIDVAIKPSDNEERILKKRLSGTYTAEIPNSVPAAIRPRQRKFSEELVNE